MVTIYTASKQGLKILVEKMVLVLNGGYLFIFFFKSEMHEGHHVRDRRPASTVPFQDQNPRG